MLKQLKQFFFELRQKEAFELYRASNQEIIFYSENYNYWPHYEGIVKCLWERYGKRIIYLTSDHHDRIFLSPPEGVTPFCIGYGSVRTSVFIGLQAKLVVMTMPDLNVFYIKRSQGVAHYAYIFHSINSCHMVYRPHAFDHFDSIFCVGRHQIEEIRSLERINKSKHKKIVKHGYGRLEALVKEIKKEEIEFNIDPSVRSESSSIKVLIAPSWGKNALLERLGGDFIRLLLQANIDVTLRPHPETIKRSSNLVKNINDKYCGWKNFKCEMEVSSKQALIEADLIVSDYSGVATEFAFSRLKPVLFVDVPRKINNPYYLAHNIEPLEVFIREEIGLIIPEDNLNSIVDYINILVSKSTSFSSKILKSRENCIYNLGQSSEVAASKLIDIFNSI